MKKAVIVMSMMAFAFFANAQTASGTTKQATPVVKVDGASNSTITTTDGNTEKKAGCEKGANEGQPCCKQGAKGECKHHGKAKGKEEAKACCQKGGQAQGCANHGTEGKSCNHGSAAPAKSCQHSEGTK